MTRERDQEGGGAEQAPPPSVDERLLRATIDVVATVGHAAAQAEDIVHAAGLSRTVFYRHFGGRRRATLAAARRVLADLERVVRAALADHDAANAATRRGVRSRPGSPGTASTPDTTRATTGLTAFAAALAADPPAAAVLFLEAPAAGPDAGPLRTALLTVIATALGDPPGLPAWSPAGAVLAVLHDRVARGDTTTLPTLVPELVRSLTHRAGTAPPPP